MLNAYRLFGRSPHNPTPPSRQVSYNLELSFSNPPRYPESSVPKSHGAPVHSLQEKIFICKKSSGQAMHFRPRAQQYSGRHKECLGHRFAKARLANAQAFLHLPPYSCLSSPSSIYLSKGSCRSFPMFLQHIAGFHFTDVPGRSVTAVYTFPSPRTAVCRYTGICLFYFGSGKPSYSCLFHRFSIP